MANSFVYQQVFGGANIYPSDISYRAIDLAGNISLSWPLETVSNANLVARIMDVNCTVAGATITMPDARLAGVGITILFNNVGTQTFLVKSAGISGSQIAQVTTGGYGLVQVYLTDNSTEQGAWRTVNYGVGSSPAQASVLAGNGLVAQGSTLATAVAVTSLDVESYIFKTTDRAVAFVWTGVAATLALPEPPSVGGNWYILIRNASLGLLTLDPLGNYEINGQPTLDLKPGDSCVIITNGQAYYTVGFGQSVKFAFDYVAINLGSPAPATYTLAGEFLNRIAYGFTGGLGADISIIVPTNKQQYWVSNGTSGNYNFYVRTSTQTTTNAPIVVQGQNSILYCDGTKVVRGNDNNVPTPIPITQGGTGATTAIGAQLSLGASSLGQGLFTVPDAQTARTLIGVTDTSALALIYAIALGG